MGSIYRLYCKESGKSYIGQHHKEDPCKRIREHFNEADCERSDAVLYKAIKKYGRDGFEASCLCVCKTQEELDFMEDYYITEYKSMSHENGYNMKRGGMKRCVGYKHTEEVKQKLSEMKKGNVISEEQRQKLSEALKGKPKIWSEEAKETMSERNKSNASGYKPTEDEKQKRSEVLKGKPKDFSQLESDEINKDIEKVKDFINEVIDNLEFDKSVFTFESYRKMKTKDIVFLRLFPKRHTLRKYGELYGCGNSAIACIIHSKSYKDIVIPKKYYEEARKYDYLFEKEKEQKQEVPVLKVPKEKMEQWTQPVYEEKPIRIPSKKIIKKKESSEKLDEVVVEPIKESEELPIDKDLKQVQSIINKIKDTLELGKTNQDHSRKLSVDQIIFLRLFPKRYSARGYGKLLDCSDAIIRGVLKGDTYKDIVIPEEYYKIATEFRFK
jgi:group I intron endonuclease